MSGHVHSNEFLLEKLEDPSLSLRDKTSLLGSIEAHQREIKMGQQGHPKETADRIEGLVKKGCLTDENLRTIASRIVEGLRS